jgi:predicted enzyme related to lactoylglutathione lyase
LFTRDTRQVLPFYRKVAGWDEFEDYRTERDDDYLLASGGFARAAMSPLPAEAKSGHWVGFVRVANIAATVAKARELGARVLVEPRTIQAGNDIAILIDPLGAIFGVAAFLEDSTRTP